MYQQCNLVFRHKCTGIHSISYKCRVFGFTNRVLVQFWFSVWPFKSSFGIAKHGFAFGSLIYAFMTVVNAWKMDCLVNFLDFLWFMAIVWMLEYLNDLNVFTLPYLVTLSGKTTVGYIFVDQIFLPLVDELFDSWNDRCRSTGFWTVERKWLDLLSNLIMIDWQMWQIPVAHEP